MKRQIVLSGIRATGKMHLGNYVGALKNFVELSEDKAMECFYFIANLHTLTTHTNPSELRESVKSVLRDFLACGIDPNVATIYAQSSIPEITELSWMLSCIAPINLLTIMPHFKEKRDKMHEAGMTENAGLLTYPVLMAADILGVKSNLVPVGDDQAPHVEFARELAKKFNDTFGELFQLPKFFGGAGLRLPGLDNRGKMSKSETSSVIYLDDTPDIVRKKLKVAITDPQRIKRYDPGDPNVCNIFNFHHALQTAPLDIARITKECKTGEIGCVECKEILSKVVNDILAPIHERRAKIIGMGTNYIDDVLHEGGLRARKVIQKTVNEAKELVGIPCY
ncbi:MAG: tryptophan--tRNA ligase [Candidatus Moraniibacteriota bacterium]